MVSRALVRFGAVTLWSACAVAVAGLLVLPTRIGQIPAVMASFAAALLLVHLLETLWLVTPAFRGHFTVGLADMLAVLGLGGLAVALLAALLPREAEDRPHVAA